MKKMNKKDQFGLVILLLIGVILLLALLLYGNNIAVLNPKGLIASKERDLMVTATLLSLIVVIPVFALTFGIAWRYRATNKKATYHPDWDHSKILESIWWGIPCALILVLAVITWTSSHALDPSRPLDSSAKPMTIQVVALQWKWLFIYPEQHIASVNFVQFPVDTPVNFEITSDAPMNSFWIPSLGGQVYAMSGMSTHLHLQASEIGNYNGLSANISGEGFAGMKFVARASSHADFEQWVQSVKRLPDHLDLQEYNELAEPTKNNPTSYYSVSETGLYDNVVTKYMDPLHPEPPSPHTHGHVDYGASQ